MCECFARTIDRIDKAIRPHRLGEAEADKTGAAADIEHAVAPLQAERFDPGRHQIGALHLPRIDLIPGGMAQVFFERLLHDTPVTPKMDDRPCGQGERRDDGHRACDRIDVGRRLSLICQAITATITSDMPSMAWRTSGAAVMKLMAVLLSPKANKVIIIV